MNYFYYIAVHKTLLMKKTLFLSLLLLTKFASAQYIPFKKYDFDKGGYSILGMKDESDYNPLAAKLGEFYTDDIKVLNMIKTTWVFDKKSPQYACGYHYIVFLCKNGKVVEDMDINLNCAVIATNKGYYFFDAQKLSFISDSLKKPLVKTQTFKSITEARKQLSIAQTDKNLIFIPHPRWEKYDGEFRFDYKSKALGNDLATRKILKKIHAQILKTYPNEPFLLKETGGSTNSISVEVTCRQSLKDKFKLYPFTFEWEPYPLDLETYAFSQK